jgi:hypothetical protein
VRRSTRIAFAVAWPVHAVAVVLAWRKVSASWNGDVTGLFIAPACGFFELLMLTSWLQDREDGR